MIRYRKSFSCLIFCLLCFETMCIFFQKPLLVRTSNKGLVTNTLSPTSTITNANGSMMQNKNNSLRLARPRLLLTSVAFVSSLNIIINLFRPDDTVHLSMRLPRVFWEACIWSVAILSQGGPSFFLLLLSVMCYPTALLDIFVWGPVFGFTTEFETCTGGWFSRPRICHMDYTKGISRLLGMVQSVVGGSFYLLTAVICWTEYWKLQNDRSVQRQVECFHRVWSNDNCTRNWHSLNAAVVVVSIVGNFTLKEHIAEAITNKIKGTIHTFYHRIYYSLRFAFNCRYYSGECQFSFVEILNLLPRNHIEKVISVYCTTFFILKQSIMNLSQQNTNNTSERTIKGIQCPISSM